MEQKAKKWFAGCVTAVLICLVAAGALMIVIDPYFHYHGPLPQLSYRLYEERYVNDGISRHFSYDAIITGTSMAQNFKTTQMDELFGTHAVKEPFSGAGFQELSENLERALKRNEELKTILVAVDYNGLLRSYDWKKYEEYPTYLYDENPFNDVSYLFNKSIWYHGALSNLVMTLQKEESTSMDAYSSWRYETGIEHILYSYSRNDLEPFENVGFGPSEEKIVTETIQKNFVDLANEYPDTQFYLFYTPYSIVYWDALDIQGNRDQQLKAEKLATEMLLACPNVKLYNFFDQYEIICNTDYYNDSCHYSGEVNEMILNWIKEDRGLLTWDNYLERLAAEEDFYANYDYDSIYAALSAK